MFACANGCTDVVELMLEYQTKIDFNAKDNLGRTALLWACDMEHWAYNMEARIVVQMILNLHKSNAIEIPTDISQFSKEIKDIFAAHHKNKKA